MITEPSPWSKSSANKASPLFVVFFSKRRRASSIELIFFIFKRCNHGSWGLNPQVQNIQPTVAVMVCGRYLNSVLSFKILCP